MFSNYCRNIALNNSNGLSTVSVLNITGIGKLLTIKFTLLTNSVIMYSFVNRNFKCTIMSNTNRTLNQVHEKEKSANKNIITVVSP